MTEIEFTVLPGNGGDIGQIVLNRPEALNALDTEMSQALLDQIKVWEQSPAIKAMIIKSSSSRAFCAGGDVRKLHDTFLNSGDTTTFFKIEYALNRALFHLKTPYIALLDGITMGGGVGISLYASHRVATSNLQFAMPEVGIGFFPDVGTIYVLSRFQDYLGYYLALTGLAIGVDDALSLDIATHKVDSAQLPLLEKALLDADFNKNSKEAAIDDVINQFVVSPSSPPLAPYYQIIRDSFSCGSVDDIITALRETYDPWAIKTADVMSSRSPTSLIMTLERLQLALEQSFDEVLITDFVWSQLFIERGDFMEGIRAQIIDKDKKPCWQPAMVL